MSALADPARQISIHASLAGGDKTGRRNAQRRRISIYASLAGGDGRKYPDTPPLANFNPRLSRGRRLARQYLRSLVSLFQSTPPSREATWRQRLGAPPPAFQSTPPSREATLLAPISAAGHTHFNPRLPRGRRRASRFTSAARCAFQSTPPSREATLHARPYSSISSFQSTPPSREATFFAMLSLLRI